METPHSCIILLKQAFVHPSPHAYGRMATSAHSGSLDRLRLVNIAHEVNNHDLPEIQSLTRTNSDPHPVGTGGLALMALGFAQEWWSFLLIELYT